MAMLTMPSVILDVLIDPQRMPKVYAAHRRRRPDLKALDDEAYPDDGTAGATAPT